MLDCILYYDASELWFDETFFHLERNFAPGAYKYPLEVPCPL